MLAKYRRRERAGLFHKAANSVGHDDSVYSAVHGLKHMQPVQTQSLYFIAVLV